MQIRSSVLPHFLVLLLGLLLQACGPDPVKPVEVAVKALDEQAQSLLSQGEYEAAADEFLRIAASAGSTQATDYRLFAAEALLDANQPERAGQILNNLNLKETDPEAGRHQLLLARQHLLSNRATYAMGILNRLAEQQLPARLHDDLYRSRAIAYDRMGNVIESVRARIALEPLLLDEADRIANRQAIWTTVSRLRSNIIEQLLPADMNSLRGWMELALLSRFEDAASFKTQLADWQNRFPQHPGNLEIVPELTRSGEILDIKPGRIAVLLPFSGRYGSAAAAIRDGMVSAWYRDDESRPELLFLDANSANIGPVYEQAINAGAEFVVGPLEKEAISVLVDKNKLPAVTLALNQPDNTDNITPADESALYLFGLSPEDEARQVAERAWFDGHLAALMVVPEGSWGERIASAFRQRWLELGGQISEQQTYSATTNDFSTPIKSLLNVNDSEDRGRLLRQTIGMKIDLEPRVRKDADFVFIAAYPKAARQIRPQLLFHEAEQLPVYATSHVFSGQPSAEADHDLDGVIFADMPWLLSASLQQSERFQSIARNWPNAASSARLYALGVDAYGLIPQLGRLLLQPYSQYQGVTGVLRVQPDGLINRQLVWAIFQDGLPRTIDAVQSDY